MPISLTSPNTANYSVGKGIIYFKPDGAAGDILDYDMGNCTEFELSPNIEKLDHFSSREGVKSKDKSIVLEKGVEARVVMEEMTPRNLALFLLATPDESVITNVTMNILADNAKRGHMRYVGNNEVGPRWTFDLPAVEFAPSGSLSPISDEWSSLEVTGEVLASDGSFGVASSNFSPLMPTNSVVPTVTGTAQVGETLTAVPGTWANGPSFSYQWQKDSGSGFFPIALAVGSTYVAVTADIGFPIRCRVTGTNSNGSLAINTAATANVIA